MGKVEYNATRIRVPTNEPQQARVRAHGPVREDLHRGGQGRRLRRLQLHILAAAIAARLRLRQQLRQAHAQVRQRWCRRQ